MAIHDWSRVEAGIFHAFHNTWVAAIQGQLNGGLLPKGYYALAEQHAGEIIADVLTLHKGQSGTVAAPAEAGEGAVAVAEAPPQVGEQYVIKPVALARRRTVAIRHVSHHRLVAVIEIVSPANKDRAGHVQEFALKVASLLLRGVHVLFIDLFAPGPHDPAGVHPIILEELTQDVPANGEHRDRPLTFVAYKADDEVVAYLARLAVGDPLPVMPLFLRPDRYVNVPLAASYDAAYRGMPEFWRGVLEGTSPP